MAMLVGAVELREDGTLVKPERPHAPKSLGKRISRSVAGPSTRMLFMTDVNFAAEKCARGKHHARRSKVETHLSLTADDGATFNKQIHNRLLEYR